MKKIIYVFLTILFLPNKIFSSGIELEKSISINGNAGAYDYCMDNKYTTDGGIISAGYSSDEYSANAILIKYDASGNREWLKTYRNTINGIDFYSKLLTDNTGNIYVAGGAYNNLNNQDILIQKYSSSGNIIWTKFINSSAGNFDTPIDFKKDNSGNLIIVFNEEDGNSHLNVSKLDVNGNILWHYRMADSVSSAFSFEIDELNNIYVAGEKATSMYSTGGQLIKFNSSGNIIWKKEGIPGNFTENPFSKIKVTSVNEIYALNYKDTNFARYTVVNKIDSSGNTIWKRDLVLNYHGRMIGKSIESDAAGNIYIINSVIPDVTNSTGDFYPGYLFVKYNSFGDSLWSKLIINPDIYSDDDAYMKINSSNEIYILCYKREGKQVGKILKFSSSGDSLASGNFYLNNTFGKILSLSINYLGNPIATGTVFQKYNLNEYYINSYNNNCQTIWEDKYDSKGFSNDAGSNLAEDINGNIFVTGSNNREAYLIKYNKSMIEQWRYKINDSDGFDPPYNFAPLISIDNSNNIYIGLSVSGNNTGYDILISKIDANGNKLFSILNSGSGNSSDILKAMTTDENNLFISGIKSIGSNYYSFFSKYSSSGNLIWEQSFDDPYNQKIIVKAEVIYFMIGNIMMKLNSDGDVVWQNIYQPNSYVNIFYDFALDKNDNMIACGVGVIPEESENYIIVKYDNNGKMKWEKKYNGLRNSTDIAKSVVVDSMNNIIVTGNADEYQNNYLACITTLKLDTNGNIVWKRIISDPAIREVAVGKVKLDKYDNVYISSGYNFYTSINFSYMLVKYKSNGDSIWSTVYNNPKFKNYANDFIITRDQDIIMTGKAYGINTGYDITTLKYSQTSGIINNNTNITYKFLLNQNYPNPFNPITKIKFDIPNNIRLNLKDVKLVIYNVLGKEIQTLVNGKLSGGSYEVEFNGSNQSSGIYFYKLEADGFIETKRMTLVK